MKGVAGAFRQTVPEGTWRIKMQGTLTRLDTQSCGILNRTRNAGFLALAVLIGSTVSFAKETGSNLPWEGPLNTLVTSLTGPVAYAISVVAIYALWRNARFRQRRNGRDDEAPVADRHCCLPGRLRRAGDVVLYRPGRGGFASSAGSCCFSVCPSSCCEGITEIKVQWGWLETSRPHTSGG